MAALGRYDDLVDDAVRFQLALRAGKIQPPPGTAGVALQDFGRFFRSQGGRARHYWTQYVRPHWKLWLGSAALSAVLLAPDEYLDEAGDIIEGGIEKIAGLGGELLAGALRGTIRGVGEAAKDSVRDTVATTTDVFFSDVWRGLALAVLLLMAVFAIPFTRRRVMAMLGILRGAANRSPKSEKGRRGG